MTAFTRSSPLAATVEALRSGRLALMQHLEATLDRLDATALDLRAFVPESGRAARLRAEAAALVDRYPTPDERPPLFGVLLGLKDIFSARGLPTGAGSAVPSYVFEMPEGTAVRRLRDAGALVLGKTVTTEFAYFEAGSTANPHDRSRSPGGSSSGSGAAVAAGISSLALGTQTVGSVLRPAAFCGVVGFKPSYGRIPRDGIIPFSASADTVGVFTQDVAGVQLAASVLCDGWAPADAAARPTLAVPDGPYLDQAAPEGLDGFEAQVARLRDVGYNVRRLRSLTNIGAINRRHQDLVAAEFQHTHRAWFSEWGALYRGGSADLYDSGRRVTGVALAAAEPSGRWLRLDLARIMNANGIDAWISPAAPGPAPTGLQATGVPIMNLPWTHAGMPAVSLPGGSVDGLPIGLQVAARFGDDERLLRWATALEVELR